MTVGSESLRHDLRLIGYFQAPKKPVKLGALVEPGYEWVEVITRGKGEVLIDQQHVPVGAGAICWHREGESTIINQDLQDPYECTIFRFCLDRKICSVMPRISYWLDLERCRMFCKHNLADYHQELYDRTLLGYQVGSRLQWEVHRYHQRGFVDRLPIKIRNMCHWMEAAPQESWDISLLAQKSRLSPSRIHELFREYLQSSPHKYLLQLRMGIARELLTMTTRSIKEVSYDAGFSNPEHFNRAFKSKHGLTPGEYREKYAVPYNISGK